MRTYIYIYQKTNKHWIIKLTYKLFETGQVVTTYGLRVLSSISMKRTIKNYASGTQLNWYLSFELSVN